MHTTPKWDYWTQVLKNMDNKQAVFKIIVSTLFVDNTQVKHRNPMEKAGLKGMGLIQNYLP